ncbi:hypothetical protein GCM10027612_65840 [Microbispora bryophytorum subsp. camponoti]
MTRLLHDAFAQGRITPEELDERLDATLSARRAEDLRRVTADLPGAWPGDVQTGALRAAPRAADTGPTLHVPAIHGPGARGTRASPPPACPVSPALPWARAPGRTGQTAPLDTAPGDTAPGVPGDTAWARGGAVTIGIPRCSSSRWPRSSS